MPASQSLQRSGNGPSCSYAFQSNVGESSNGRAERSPGERVRVCRLLCLSTSTLLVLILHPPQRRGDSLLSRYQRSHAAVREQYAKCELSDNIGSSFFTELLTSKTQIVVLRYTDPEPINRLYGLIFPIETVQVIYSLCC
ncbi:hypothetical protein K431DRAFT_54477 [Polychaeton citri CBS 116435]|uniref:Uncharacterized protein n=1 Tax=Polychaeton citri CBS 116435 TaxID=1314669 RepID=A0A9P4UUK2_9PEZI|nr:hypothetical protein K431DRAFT_54477 [Polychaeton citri CBS 116435]